jgi:hypothetical protein
MGEVAKANMKLSIPIRILGIALVGLIILLTPVPAFAQSCSLCYTQAASSGARMIHALQSGILILVLPPTLGSIGMIFVVYHKRNQVRRTESGAESRQDW